jgi:hypothetical protein
LTVTLTVAWALFALAPGLAVFAGLFLSKGEDVVHPAAPAPTSIPALAIVVFGALALHTVFAAAFALNDLVPPILRTPFEPNVYTYFLSGRRNADVGVEAALLLIILVAQSGLGFWISRSVAGSAKAGSTLHAFFYGWLSPVLGQLKTEPGYLKHMVAWVVTDLEAGDLAVGYEGQVETLALNSDKQIAWLTLRNCETFVIAADEEKRAARRRSITRDVPIPRLQIEGPHIVNFAFAVVLIAEEASTPETVDKPNP